MKQVTTVELMSAWYEANRDTKTIEEASQEVSRHNQELIREARYSTLMSAADAVEQLSGAVAATLRRSAELYKEIAE